MQTTPFINSKQKKALIDELSLIAERADTMSVREIRGLIGFVIEKHVSRINGISTERICNEKAIRPRFDTVSV